MVQDIGRRFSVVTEDNFLFQRLLLGCLIIYGDVCIQLMAHPLFNCQELKVNSDTTLLHTNKSF